MEKTLKNLLDKLTNLVPSNSKSPKTLADYNRETLVKAGKQQFERLKDLGLSIPVAHL